MLRSRLSSFIIGLTGLIFEVNGKNWQFKTFFAIKTTQRWDHVAFRTFMLPQSNFHLHAVPCTHNNYWREGGHSEIKIMLSLLGLLNSKRYVLPIYHNYRMTMKVILYIAAGLYLSPQNWWFEIHAIGYQPWLLAACEHYICKPRLRNVSCDLQGSWKHKSN